LDKAVSVLGTAMMLVWTLGIGIVGFAVLLAIAWASVFQSHTLAIALGFLVIAPLLLTLLWAVLTAVDLLKERWAVQLVVQRPSWQAN